MPNSTRIPGIEGIHHVSIHCVDWEGSLRLYGERLGLTRTAEARLPDGRRIVRYADRAGYEIELVSSEETAPTSGPIAHIALSVVDVDEAIRAVEAAGYPVTVPSTALDVEGLRATIAFFTGPNGESLELIRIVAPRSAD